MRGGTKLLQHELFLNWIPKTRLALLKHNLQARIDTNLDRQKRHRARPIFFKVGENVFVKTVRQEKIDWVPGKILEIKSPVKYFVSVLGKVRRCHADHLRSRVNMEEEGIAVPSCEARSPMKPVLPERGETSEDKERQQVSPRRQSPLKDPETAAVQPRHEDPPAVVQCSPPNLRRSKRTIQKPDKLDF
ncbi:uncharacterized protein LOC128995672 [Macrosteles quadrilineatus]|uniref:uncharacterized protein LOC128995672 n=1 Tax=Macrosteles quadrilineatus TaxID=74068 RepID=UPI0023E18AD2|nr:uncharacterized protein LOC128995672 [Macrosteles quadrilineatus]